MLTAYPPRPAAPKAALATTALLVAAAALSACRDPIYDIDAMSDPVAKARYSCQYLLERALADPAELDPDGVLRRRVADFADPHIRRDGAAVQVTWPPGAIMRRAAGSRHEGACAVTMREQGRRIDALVLDGRPLHAGFGM